MAWIDLEGAVNVRDLGGLPTADGGSTMAGRLLRSENLQELSAADVARLVGEIGVTTIVDLRTTAEVEIEGPGPLDAEPRVLHKHHPVLPELGNRTDAVAEALLVKKAARDRSRFPDDIMCGHYLGYLEERPDEVTGALRSIATSAGAAIVHCAAGKDRTGVIVALALSVAGVEPDAIVADYMATGERINAIIERLRRSRTYAADVSNRPVTAHLPREETMKAFLEQLHVRYGGLDQWLDDNGFAAGERAQLRAKLTGA
jgi:protein tyrosine/serine phosphatase